jgi:putative transposase
VSSDHAESVALWRFSLIAEAIGPRLTPAERGRLVRQVATRAHTRPDGTPCTVSRNTLDRWLRAYRERGLDGLRPGTRVDSGVVRRHPELFEEAAALRLEQPARSAAQIAAIIGARHGVHIAERTLREHLQRRGLQRAALTAEVRAFGRYEAARPNERWLTDVMVGPFVPHPQVAGSRRARGFLIVDDHSRLLVHGRWMADENARAGQAVLRAAIARRGVPEQLYCDCGSPFIAAPLARTCAVLGIRLIHSKPYSPEGRGKQERLHRVIRERFLLEAEAAGIPSFAVLNDRFQAWVEAVLNCRVHRETGQTPIARFLAGGAPRAADPSLLAEAFRWSVVRRVTRTATVSVAGNRYSVDPALIGRPVELRYDPEDLSRLDVFVDGRPMGAAVPLVIGRHTHPAVPQAARPPAEPTGIDYLGLVLDDHEQSTTSEIAYRDLTEPPAREDTAADLADAEPPTSEDLL